MRLAHRFWLSAFFFAVAALSPALGDTVYLKNGAWIDGRVRSRNEKVLEIEIGKIGKMEINVEEIHEIEKNNRTGDETYDRRNAEEKEADQNGVFRLTREGKRAKKDGAPPKNPEDDDSEDDERSAGKKKSDADSTESKEKGKPDDTTPAKIDPELKARIEELVGDLERQKPQFRVRAERHLKAIGSPAIPFLIPLAKSESDLTRLATMRLFNDFGDETVTETLIDALGDSNEYVRDLANKTLERITHENFGFQAQAAPRRRENAQEKWRKWWQKEKEALTKERHLSAKEEHR